MSVATIDLTDKINLSYAPMFNSHARELVVYGGAGAGKSYAVAQKLILKAIGSPGSNMVVIRKYGPALKLTCWTLVLDLLNRYGIPYEDNKTELKLKVAGSTIHFLPVVVTSGEAAERLKSLTDITDIWIEEATELSLEEYHQVRLRLRGEELENGYRQIVLTFNPIDRNHWIHSYFFEGNRGEHQHYTYKDNRFIEQAYIDELEGLKDIDETLYQIYALGDWGTFGNLIYTRYEIAEFDHPFDWYDDILAGCDFGYENPSALTLIGLKENTAYIIDEVYERKLVNAELVERIQDKQQHYNILPTIFCDSAEPARVEEMARAGLQVYPAEKNVADGINAVKSYKLVIHPRCVNTLKEMRGYCRKKDRQGNVLEEPVKANDHTCDALRYALYTYKRLTYAPQPEVLIYDDPYVISPY